MRNHFGRQRPVALGPAHIPLNALSKRLLAGADLQRTEPGIVADLLRDHLVDGRPARAAARESLAGHERAHRAVMAFPVGIVEAGDDVNVFLERLQRLQARRDVVVRSQFARNPVILHDPVAVEPQHETRLDRRRSGLRRIRRPAAVKHGCERGQPDPDSDAAQSNPFQKRTPGYRHLCAPSPKNARAAAFLNFTCLKRLSQLVFRLIPHWNQISISGSLSDWKMLRTKPTTTSVPNNPKRQCQKV